MFVKPANAGSSVGVHKVKLPSELAAAIADALLHDDKILIESGVDAREIECAVLGNDRPMVAVPGEIVVTHPDGFYSYDAKYVDASGSHVELPARIPAETAEQFRQMAAKAFIALELSGLSRIDFFLDRKSGAVYLNEVNTIPGFTAISMYPKMWEAAGVSQVDLISRLIDLARERHERRRNRS
jgi:D-alanine-D-alanine ligase